MGNLLIHPEGFEFAGESSARREVLNNFIDGGNCARRNGDEIHSNPRLDGFQYSYGNFFTHIAFNPWPELKKNDKLNWITQATHQALQSFFYAYPSGKGFYSSLIELQNAKPNEHNGLLGCLMAAIPPVYVSCIPTWQKWRVAFFSSNPGQINWAHPTDPFLPNLAHSNEILLKELESHKKSHCIKDYNGDIALTFHKEVMQHKGPDLAAYARSIGGLIAESNFYIFDEDLSKNEREAAKNSPRAIYKLQKNGAYQYISIDHAHGFFEFHNHLGDHLGEMRFDGQLSSPVEVNHGLKTL